MLCGISDVVLPYTGGSIGGLGVFGPCADNGALKYCLAGYNGGTEGTTQYLGVCLRRNCSKEFVAEIATYLAINNNVSIDGDPTLYQPTGPADTVYCTGFQPTWSGVEIFASTFSSLSAARSSWPRCSTTSPASLRCRMPRWLSAALPSCLPRQARRTKIARTIAPAVDLRRRGARRRSFVKGATTMPSRRRATPVIRHSRLSLRWPSVRSRHGAP
jgi:hypothetical protein